VNNKEFSILIVDDEAALRNLLATFLGDDYTCVTAASPDEAVAELESRCFNLVLSDITMPGTSGLDLCHLLQKMCPDTVVVMVSAMTDIAYAIEAMRQGAFDYVTKPFDLSRLLMAVERALRYQQLLVAERRNKQTLKETVQVRTEELRKANDGLNRLNASLNEALSALHSNYRATLRALAGTLEAKDFETRGHSDRVVANCVRLGREMGLSDADLFGLEQGALLHDIGKIGVPDAILLKPGPLTDQEWHQMRQHIDHGLRIIGGIDFLSGARPVVGQHHEKYDGSGYPNGLRGESIHIHARIFAVADAYDAITSDRPYRNGMGYATAREQIVKGSGTHFDPKVVAAFLRIPEPEWTRIRNDAGYDSTEEAISGAGVHSFVLSLIDRADEMTSQAKTVVLQRSA
jgi:response regulator RpfG family c-di-GMP phosphodiesterase